MSQLERWQKRLSRQFPSGALVFVENEDKAPVRADKLNVPRMAAPFTPVVNLDAPGFSETDLLISSYDVVSERPLMVRVRLNSGESMLWTVPPAIPEPPAVEENPAVEEPSEQPSEAVEEEAPIVLESPNEEETPADEGAGVSGPSGGSYRSVQSSE